MKQKSVALRSLLAVLCIFFLSLSACGEKKEPTDPEGISKRFMELYYVDRDAGSAAKLSTGFAAYKIANKFQQPPGTQWNSASPKPKAKVKLISSDPANEAEISYHYEVLFNSPEIIDREVFVNMRQLEGRWQVHQYIERAKVEKKKDEATPIPLPE